MYGILKVSLVSHFRPEKTCYLLLEQDRAETSIESTDTLILQHLAKSTNETIRICGLRDETDTGSLKGAERDISEELSDTGRCQVNGCTVVGSSLISEERDGLLLEQLVTSELERALEKVTSSSWAKTSQKSSSTLVLNDLSESPNETLVVCNGIELYSCLDAAPKEN